ncbi:MAG: hypothetical protein ABH821_00840 [archaeon]
MPVRRRIYLKPNNRKPLFFHKLFNLQKPQPTPQPRKQITPQEHWQQRKPQQPTPITRQPHPTHRKPTRTPRILFKQPTRSQTTPRNPKNKPNFQNFQRNQGTNQTRMQRNQQPTHSPRNQQHPTPPISHKPIRNQNRRRTPTTTRNQTRTIRPKRITSFPQPTPPPTLQPTRTTRRINPNNIIHFPKTKPRPLRQPIKTKIIHFPQTRQPPKPPSQPPTKPPSQPHSKQIPFPQPLKQAIGAETIQPKTRTNFTRLRMQEKNPEPNERNPRTPQKDKTNENPEPTRKPNNTKQNPKTLEILKELGITNTMPCFAKLASKKPQQLEKEIKELKEIMPGIINKNPHLDALIENTPQLKENIQTITKNTTGLETADALHEHTKNTKTILETTTTTPQERKTLLKQTTKNILTITKNTTGLETELALDAHTKNTKTILETTTTTTPQERKTLLKQTTKNILTITKNTTGWETAPALNAHTKNTKTILETTTTTPQERKTLLQNQTTITKNTTGWKTEYTLNVHTQNTKTILETTTTTPQERKTLLQNQTTITKNTTGLETTNSLNAHTQNTKTILETTTTTPQERKTLLQNQTTIIQELTKPNTKTNIINALTFNLAQSKTTIKQYLQLLNQTQQNPKKLETLKKHELFPLLIADLVQLNNPDNNFNWTQEKFQQTLKKYKNHEFKNPLKPHTNTISIQLTEPKLKQGQTINLENLKTTTNAQNQNPTTILEEIQKNNLITEKEKKELTIKPLQQQEQTILKKLKNKTINQQTLTALYAFKLKLDNTTTLPPPTNPNNIRQIKKYFNDTIDHYHSHFQEYLNQNNIKTKENPEFIKKLETENNKLETEEKKPIEITIDTTKDIRNAFDGLNGETCIKKPFITPEYAPINIRDKKTGESLGVIITFKKGNTLEIYGIEPRKKLANKTNPTDELVNIINEIAKQNNLTPKISLVKGETSNIHEIAATINNNITNKEILTTTNPVTNQTKKRTMADLTTYTPQTAPPGPHHEIYKQFPTRQLIREERHQIEKELKTKEITLQEIENPQETIKTITRISKQIKEIENKIPETTKQEIINSLIESVSEITGIPTQYIKEAHPNIQLQQSEELTTLTKANPHTQQKIKEMNQNQKKQLQTIINKIIINNTIIQGTSITQAYESLPLIKTKLNKINPQLTKLHEQHARLLQLLHLQTTKPPEKAIIAGKVTYEKNSETNQLTTNITATNIQTLYQELLKGTYTMLTPEKIPITEIKKLGLTEPEIINLIYNHETEFPEFQTGPQIAKNFHETLTRIIEQKHKTTEGEKKIKKYTNKPRIIQKILEKINIPENQITETYMKTTLWQAFSKLNPTQTIIYTKKIIEEGENINNNTLQNILNALLKNI